jgi:hypothetical protein
MTNEAVQNEDENKQNIHSHRRAKQHTQANKKR